MSSTDIERRAAARDFAEKWQGRGEEKQETSPFWMSLLGDVFGVNTPADYILFEKPVKLTHTSFIDAYIPATHVLIEQKSIDIDLGKAYQQSDGASLTPFEQAKRYANEMPHDQHPRWIVVSNFAEIHIHDMNRPAEPPEIVRLADLEKDYYRLQFLVDTKSDYIRREEQISIQAGLLVRKLYNALLKEYRDPTADSLRSLNILCVRLVFCLYAEDAGLFASRTAFEDYIRSFNTSNVRFALINLFKALDTKESDRDKYDETTRPFPYVNGGLFRDEQIEIPNFTQEIVDVIVNDCAPFNWSDISPTIFGAVFESTLNPDTRRAGGMHYTSVENIHKVIDPLFMEDLEAEFAQIMTTTAVKTRRQQLHDFQKKLGSLKFLDPACGSGNFLTEAFLSLRRLENRVISALNDGEAVLGLDNFIQVDISQFYGIEINDFAAVVAKTALWIAESQMVAETEKILSQNIDFLPLKTNASIVEGNALRTDWATLKPLDGSELPDTGLFAGITTHVDGTAHRYDYIMGNPPFVGRRYRTESQQNDIKKFFEYKDIDYVACWFYKAAELIRNTNTKVAFVSTNSITQGEQVAALWKPLFKDFGVKINFAHRTFRWDSESTQKAHVHCVIVGFGVGEAASSRLSNNKLSGEDAASPKRRIFDGEKVEFAENINAYLVNAPDVFIEIRNKPLCDVPPMKNGNVPLDGDALKIEIEDYPKFEGCKFVKRLMGGRELLHNEMRYVLWLVDASPKEIKNNTLIYNRVERCRQNRLAMKDKGTQKLAATPATFRDTNNPENYIALPMVSSENRRYLPMAYLHKDVIPTNQIQTIPNATLYHFGILTSSVHMAWMRAVCGRLEMRYRYSKDIVYNNFPWPSETSQTHDGKDGLPTVHDTKIDSDSNSCKSMKDGLETVPPSITRTAQAILDARAKYPDCSLADLYDETTMPAELRKAHAANDRAVMKAYGFRADMTEGEIVAELFKTYEKLTV